MMSPVQLTPGFASLIFLKELQVPRIIGVKKITRDIAMIIYDVKPFGNGTRAC
jgi:hypothetical protein